jgi:hypothetical protein
VTTRRSALFALPLALAALVAAGVAGSRPGSAAAAADPADAAATVATLDSAIGREEALARFRAGLPPADSLDAGAATDRDSLVRGFVRAVAARDSAALRGMLLSRGEFAWLFYPTSAQGRPPYDLAPQLMWALLHDQTNAGLSETLARMGDRPLALVDYSCAERPIVEGRNRIWGDCTLRVASGRDTVAERLTGPIVERDGRYKFVSYTSDMD